MNQKNHGAIVIKMSEWKGYDATYLVTAVSIQGQNDPHVALVDPPDLVQSHQPAIFPQILNRVAPQPEPIPPCAMALTDYEKERLERIAKNKAILAALDIPKALNSTPKRVAKASPKKRKRRDSDVDGDSTVETVDRPPLARRASARLQNIVKTFLNLTDCSNAVHTMTATMRNQNERRQIRILDPQTRLRMVTKRTLMTR